MYCIECRYPLTRHASNACPECGRSFNPGDSSTFLAQTTKPHEFLEHASNAVWRISLSLCGLCVFLGLVSLIFAMMEPGVDASDALHDCIVLILGPAAALIFRRRIACHYPIGRLLRPITGLVAIGLLGLLILIFQRERRAVAEGTTADLVELAHLGVMMTLIATAALTLTTSGRLFWLGGTRAPPRNAPRSSVHSGH